MGEIFDLIRDGDLRMGGGSGAASALVRTKPALAGELVDLLNHPNAGLRMRAADALEKASAGHEALLMAHKAQLLELADNATQHELRGCLAQILPRLDLDGDEVREVAALFQRWYAKDVSRIVRTNALQGMADLAVRDNGLIGTVQAMAQDAAASPIPALKVRARKVKVVLDRLKSRQGS